MDYLTLIFSAVILGTAGLWIFLTRIVVKHKNKLLMIFIKLIDPFTSSESLPENEPKTKVNYNIPEEDPEFYNVLAYAVNQVGGVEFRGDMGYGFAVNGKHDMYLIKDDGDPTSHIEQAFLGGGEEYIGSLEAVYARRPYVLNRHSGVSTLFANISDMNTYKQIKKRYAS